MNKPFAVFDLDGTLFRSSLYFEVVQNLSLKGKLGIKASEVIDAGYKKWKEREKDESFWEYVESIMTTFESSLKELSPADYDSAVVEVFESQKKYTYAYPRELLAKLKTDGCLLLAISGSQQEIVESFCRYWGFDDWVGSVQTRSIDGMKFTGEVSVTHKDKTELLKKLVSKHGLSYEGSMAIGDTQGDIHIMEMVERAIAFNPNRQLYDYARQKHWDIVIERKNVVVKLQNRDQNYILVD